MLLGYLCQYFAIQLNIIFFEVVDKGAVVDVFGVECCTNLCLPECSFGSFSLFSPLI